MNPLDANPNDPLEALLREETSSYVEDHGFTARVISALPRKRRAWLRPVLVGAAAMIGAVLAISGMWGGLPDLDWSAVRSLNGQVLLPWVPVFLAGLFLVYGLVEAVGTEE